MDKEEKQERLKRMRSALKQGRDQRKIALSEWREDVDLERTMVWPHMNPPDNFHRVLDEASARNMLARTTVHLEDGSKRDVELGHVKWREPYAKRPSIRAMKKSLENKGPDV